MRTKKMNTRAKSGKPKAQFERARRLWAPGRRASKQKKLEAMKWYRNAAELGYPEAQVALGEIQLESDLPFCDPAAGLDWIRRAAEQGHVNAQRFLGMQLATGENVERNPKKAAYWYRKAALSGHADAQYNLGVMYWEGDGVTKNAKTARKWIARAAKNGDHAAIELLADAYETGELGFRVNSKQAKYWQEQKRRFDRSLERRRKTLIPMRRARRAGVRKTMRGR